MRGMKIGFLQKEKCQIRRCLWAQVTAVLVVAVLFGFFSSGKAGLSVLLGGLAWILPSIYFAFRIFWRKAPEMKPAQLLRAFLWGELVKLLLSAILLIIIFKYLAIAIFPLLVGYIIAIAVLSFAPLVM